MLRVAARARTAPRARTALRARGGIRHLSAQAIPTLLWVCVLTYTFKRLRALDRDIETRELWDETRREELRESAATTRAS